MSFELDCSCYSLSCKIDMFASCGQTKGNVLMRKKQRIFQMIEYNLKTKVSYISWFATKHLQHAAIIMSSGH